MSAQVEVGSTNVFVLSAPLSAQLTALQAKVHYLRYLSELRLYGGREFHSILLVRALSSAQTLPLPVPRV